MRSWAPGLRSSGFPSWMFTLPVRTPWLVIWPMLSSAVTVALAWWAIGRFALNAVGLEVPLLWPALGLACTLAWIQAVDWSPLGSIAKAIVAGMVLGGLWTGLLRDDFHTATEWSLPVLLLLAYAAAVAGVSRARRGGRTEGGLWQGGAARSPGWHWERKRPFVSPQQAQFWLEWRRNGAFLPLLAACWVVLGTLTIYFSRGGVPAMLQLNLVLPLLLAPLAGLVLGKPDAWSRQVRLPTFAAGRPLSCGDMVRAKIRMTALSLLLAWVILAAGSALWIYWGWEFGEWHRLGQNLTEAFGNGKIYLLLAAAFVGLFGFNLLLLSGAFALSMTGRLWILMAALFFYLGGIPNLMALDPLKSMRDYLFEVGDGCRGGQGVAGRLGLAQKLSPQAADRGRLRKSGGSLAGNRG